jgi:membrane protein
MNVKKIAAGAMDTFPGKVVRKFIEDQSPSWAILIAWNALFSMFPILLLVIAVLGLVVGGHEGSSTVQNLVGAIPDKNAQQSILSGLAHVHQASGIFFIVGLLGLIWGGSALFGTMDMAFAVLYHTKQRDFLHQKLMAIFMIALFTVFVLASTLTSSVLPALGHVAGSPPFLRSGAGRFILQVIIGIVAGTILFGSIYFVVPNRRQSWRKVWPGALGAGVLFELISLLFPLYLTLNKGINQYGSFFALFFVMLMFFYFFGLITLLGVEINAVFFPVPVEQPTGTGEPGRTTATAPPQSGPEGEGALFPGGRQPQPARSDRQPVPVGGQARVVGRRAASGDGQVNGDRRRASGPRQPAPLLVLGSIAVGFFLGRRTTAGGNS